MSSIFISYRRDDTIDVAGRIYDRLTAEFGRDVVFKDVGNIPAGEDFRIHLKKVLGECRVLLVLIGPNWLTLSDEKGNRRIDHPEDWVRIEIEEALNRPDVKVIPLLVGKNTNKIGWTKDGFPLSYSRLVFDINAPEGHLPTQYNEVIQRSIANRLPLGFGGGLIDIFPGCF